jgi:hypothetical protein
MVIVLRGFKLEYAHKYRTFDKKQVRQVELGDTGSPQCHWCQKMNTEEHLITKIQKSVANRSK